MRPTMAEHETNPNPNRKTVSQSELTNEAKLSPIAPSPNSESSVKLPANSSGATVIVVDDNSLEFSDELMCKGNAALKECDYSEASELFSRALEIRVAHYGELAPECVNLYYKFGLALLYKAQEEADPLGTTPKKDTESKQDSVKIESAKTAVERTSSIASVSSNIEQCSSSTQQKDIEDGNFTTPSKSDKEKDDESDTEERGEDEEDESDLDLAWKMLDLARAISEKQSEETIDKVDILSALAEVSLEREDFETSLSDYQKALSILEHLVEPDSRRIAELNFRSCLCLEIVSKAEEAIPYCRKAVSVCKSRMQRLMDEMKTTSASTAITETLLGGSHSSVASKSENSVSDTQAEIETLTSLSDDLEKKLEDLQQQLSRPSSILSDILGLAPAKAMTNEQMTSSEKQSSSRMGVVTNDGDFDSPTVSTAHTNGSPEVKHLGVVGRGVKRVVMTSGGVESSSTKRRAVDPNSGSPA